MSDELPIDRTPLVTRRDLPGAGAMSGAALAMGALDAQALTRRAATKLPPSLPAITETYDFNRGWRFGGAAQLPPRP